MKIGKRIVVAAVMMVMIVTGSSMTAEAAKFNPTFYAAKYADVKAAFGTDANALYNHYITLGQKEGRMPDANAKGGAAVDGMAGAAKFNPTFYAAEYADVRAAFGTNEDALYNHYTTCGQKEGRKPYAGASGGESVSGIATVQERQAAQTPTTYVVKYVVNDPRWSDGWRFQTASTNLWTEDGYSRELYYLEKDIKDGDILVITDSVAPADGLNLKLSVNLNNITFNHAKNAIITVNSVENVYVLRDSVGVINGNVTNAYVYDNAIVNFNNNVTNLYVTEASSSKQSIGVMGTVGYVEEYRVMHGTRKFYSFKKGTYSMEEGTFKTNRKYYSLTP